MINNRQAGRRRGRGGQRQGGNQGRGPESGNRIDSRARGNANQLLEKYKNLASDAQRQGDRVNTEYYLQFADHYFRVLADNRARFEEANPHARQQRDDRDDDFDGDDNDGFDPAPRRAERARDDRPRDDGRRDERQYDDRPRDARDDRPRDDRPRDDRQREDRGQRTYRAATEDGQGDGGGDAEREPRRRREPRPRIESAADGDRLSAAALPPAIQLGVEGEPARDDELPAPRRRGRPRKVEPTAEAAAE